MTSSARLSASLSVLCALAALGCESPPPEPAARNSSSTSSTSGASLESAPASVKTPKAKVSADDPLKGEFSLEDATKDLPGKGPLEAKIQTSLGALTCKLFEDKAPRTVANFVGLARGLRPFKDPVSKKWVERPGYDGTTFHRIIRGFMIQGGDPAGTGGGEPGYVIEDEIWPGAKHDERGLLCMANRGKNTNGMQFFILDAPAPHLDGGYTIFGKCSPDSVIEKIASTQVAGERPVAPPRIEKITIGRGS